jgi:formate dehydrogenase subunit gamma
MEFFRRALNPWAEQVLVGLSWDLMWMAAIAGAAFVVAHALYVRFVARPEPAPSRFDLARLEASLPEQIERHTRASRASHWILAVSVLVLLVTGFVPILGLKFPWVTVHWIAGLVLALYTVFHTVHVVRRRTLHTMWISREEIGEQIDRLKRFLGRRAPEPRRPGKWAFENKGFHHLTMVAGLVVVATGLLMMLRIRTPFAEANPYVFSDATWGVVFVLHGLSSVMFIATTTMHIYFAIRPEKRWMTWSMIRGPISRRDYVAHHDPERWPVPPRAIPIKGVTPAQPPAPATHD